MADGVAVGIDQIPNLDIATPTRSENPTSGSRLALSVQFNPSVPAISPSLSSLHAAESFWLRLDHCAKDHGSSVRWNATLSSTTEVVPNIVAMINMANVKAFPRGWRQQGATISPIQDEEIGIRRLPWLQIQETVLGWWKTGFPTSVEEV
ncbi:hypothetical protein ColLi_09870 [Colletotrichum liriopes]|uniref:Uncharacterized protein n=1 Tax=Colletotrichum liriopes TaxID=708192 RepID=A0AA37GV34_9PEZI|nr:hypothetical protein ColLi_09870 [Colletotrichum liriopes]